MPALHAERCGADALFAPGCLRRRLVYGLVALMLTIGTAASALAPCGGDCSGNGSVSVDELIVGVRIALGDLPASQCELLDRNGDGAVTVDDLVAAVGNSVLGCGPRIVLGSAVGFDQQIVEIPVKIQPRDLEIVRIQGLTFTVDGGSVSFLRCVSTVAGKAIQVVSSTRTVVLSLSGDPQPFANGTVASCTFEIAPGAPVGKTTLDYVTARLVDAMGAEIRPPGLDGAVFVAIPTPTQTPTRTPTPTPTVTQTFTKTPTSSPTSAPTTSVTGICRRPGPGGLIGCVGDRIVVSACRTEPCHARDCVEEPAPCVRDPARRTVVGEGRTESDGTFSIIIPEDPANDRLLIEANVTDQVIYRALVSGATAPADPSIVVDTSSEATLSVLSRDPELCDPAGSGPTVACEPLLENTTDAAIDDLLRAVRAASRGGSVYAGLDAQIALGVGRALAIQVGGIGIEQKLLRADDGTIYEVVAGVGAVRVLGLSTGETFRVTTLGASSSSSVDSCFDLPRAPAGPLSAVVGVPSLPVSALYPPSSTSRTSVVAVPSVRMLLGEKSFVPSGSGRITVETENAALNVCANATDCAGRPGVASVMALNAADSRVPSACAARQAASPCSENSVDHFSFELPPTEGCSATTSSTACSVPPADGFALSPGEAIVFIYRDVDPASVFSAGIAGFEIDRDDANTLGCGAFSIVGAGSRVDTLPGAAP